MDKLLANLMGKTASMAAQVKAANPTTNNTNTTNKTTISTDQTAALLTKQLTANGDISNILNTALETVMNNPEYQKQQITSELQQNLQAAQLNEQTAPL